MGAVPVSTEERAKLRARVVNMIDSTDKIEFRIVAFRGYDKIGESWVVVDKASFRDKQGRVDNARIAKHVRDEMRNFLKMLKQKPTAETLETLEVTEDEL